MVKSQLFLLVLCALIHSSVQELKPETSFENKLEIKIEEAKRPWKTSETNQIVCGCDDAPKPDKCKTKANTWYKIVSYVKKPITTFLEKIQILTIDNEDESDEMQSKTPLKPSVWCQKETVLKCDDDKHKITVTKAHLSNKDKNTCPKNWLVAPRMDEDEDKAAEKTTCDERIKPTELAKKMCDGKTECEFSVDKDFGSMCECATQKYLSITYSCDEEKPQKTVVKDEKDEKDDKDDAEPKRANREKRLIRLNYRIGQGQERRDQLIRHRVPIEEQVVVANLGEGRPRRREGEGEGEGKPKHRRREGEGEGEGKPKHRRREGEGEGKGRGPRREGSKEDSFFGLFGSKGEEGEGEGQPRRANQGRRGGPRQEGGGPRQGGGGPRQRGGGPRQGGVGNRQRGGDSFIRRPGIGPTIEEEIISGSLPSGGDNFPPRRQAIRREGPAINLDFVPVEDFYSRAGGSGRPIRPVVGGGARREGAVQEIIGAEFL